MEPSTYIALILPITLIVYLIVEYHLGTSNKATEKEVEEPVVEKEPEVEQPKPVKKKPGRPKKKVVKSL